jgi:hypothetical protein
MLMGAGFVFAEDNVRPLFDQLPPLIHFCADSQTAYVPRSFLNALAHEAVGSKPGAALVLDHLTCILFVNTLRGYEACEEHLKVGSAPSPTRRLARHFLSCTSTATGN